MKKMTIATLLAAHNIKSAIELDFSAEVTFVESQSRWTGTGYSNDVYRILGTDDALVILNNCVSCVGGIEFYDSFEVRKGYFADRRNYGRRCREVAQMVGLPFEVVLAVGPEHAAEFKQLVDARVAQGPVSRKDWHELVNCGIARRTAAIARILGTGVADGMGQINSTRIADYIADRIPVADDCFAVAEEDAFVSEPIGTSLGAILAAVL